MKRLAVSTLAAACSFLLTATAHASYVEKGIVDDPAWKTQEEVDAQREADQGIRSTDHRTVEERAFDETDDGSDAEFGEKLKDDIEPIRLAGGSSVTRAEFTAMLVRSMYSRETIDSCYVRIAAVRPPRFTLLFRDVPADHAFGPEICVAMMNGLVRGYGNDVFKPDGQMTFADAAKVLARAKGLTPWADASKPEHWFDQYVSALARRNAIPTTVASIEERITGAEAREMIRRLDEDDRTQPSRTADDLIQAWERAYAPRPVVVRPAPVRPIVPSKPAGSAGSAASRAPAATASKASTPATASAKPASAPPAASAGSAASRPKAWYEF
jgi:hypothetical protein